MSHPITRSIALTVTAAVTALLLALCVGPAVAGEPENPGKATFLQYKCNVCHTVTTEGIELAAAATDDDASDEPADAAEDAVVPKDLSGVGNDVTAEVLQDFLRKKAELNGKLHRKRFKGTKEERDQLIAWILSLKTAAPASQPTSK